MPTFMELFKTRHYEEELMDLPGTSHDDFELALRDIQWVNRNLGGTQAVLDELIRLIPLDSKGKMLTILDIGTGSADIPRALVDWARSTRSQHGISFQITAVDVHPVAIEAARRESQTYPEIRVVQQDALNLDYGEDSYDLVISSMFMHHLENEDAIRLLQEMARLCRIGFVVNDLERHPLAWLSIKALGIATGKGKVFQNDAPLSVLRGFTGTELEEFRRLAGLADMEIKHCWPFRWILSWKQPWQSGFTYHTSTPKTSALHSPL
jgi:phospholipid N-methyltransferase